MSDATGQKIDPTTLGPAFPRTHHVLWLEFGNRNDFDDPLGVLQRRLLPKKGR